MLTEGAALACGARDLPGQFRPSTDAKSLMRKHLLAIAVILTTATGCDNVAWGGIDVDLKPPPESPRPDRTGDEPDPDSGPVNVAGPLLLAGVRTGTTADFVLVGEILSGEMSAFPDPAFPEDTVRLAEATSVGSEWILFSEGVRIGRMVVSDARPASGYCGARTEVSGVVEVVPTAAGAERMLALPVEDATDLPYADYESLSDVYDQRVATLTIAGEAIPRYGASWPTQGVLDARDHIQAFRLAEAPGQSVAATFMYQDELGVVSPGQGAYSLFVLGEESGGEYEETYTWYRSVETEGKGAPRYFDHLDWDGDGTDEILLDVLGSNRRWFAVLSREEGAWTRTFQDACGSGSTNGG